MYENLVASLIGALVGASGTAFGLVLAMRTNIADLRLEHSTRLTRVESKIGITEDGALTGNGLIGSVAGIHAQLQED